MEEAPSRAQWIVKTNDVITSTVRPIRRLSALIEPEQNNYICSSGFAVLKPTKIEPEVLLVYLRSPAQKGKSGGYGLIYYVKTATGIILLTVYSKSEQVDIAAKDIQTIIAEYEQQTINDEKRDI
ncbi:MAG: hypothetical protein RMY36_026460 [Nostoc sp. SerVER01]|nr:hypothetical protein [Nostoc sp. SerVER01]